MGVQILRRTANDAYPALYEWYALVSAAGAAGAVETFCAKVNELSSWFFLHEFEEWEGHETNLETQLGDGGVLGEWVKKNEREWEGPAHSALEVLSPPPLFYVHFQTPKASPTQGLRGTFGLFSKPKATER